MNVPSDIDVTLLPNSSARRACHTEGDVKKLARLRYTLQVCNKLVSFRGHSIIVKERSVLNDEFCPTA